MDSTALNAAAKAIMPNAAKRAVAKTKTSKSFPGWMLIIGAEKDSHLFVGWAPHGGVQALCDRVQFGSPREMEVRYFFKADEAAVAHWQKVLAIYRSSHVGANWFHRSAASHFEDLRDELVARFKRLEKAPPAKRKSKGNKRRRQRSN